MDNPLVQLDPGLFIWTIVAFLVLLALLAKFAWRPLLQALEARQQTIRSRSTMPTRRGRSWSGCIRSRRGSSARRGSRRKRSSREPCRCRAAAGRDEAEGPRRSRGDRQERRAADSARDARALHQIRNEAADLSVAIASKLIHRNLSKEDNERGLRDATPQEHQSCFYGCAASPDGLHLGEQLQHRQVRVQGAARASLQRRAADHRVHDLPRADRVGALARRAEVLAVFSTPAPITRADWAKLAGLGVVGHFLYQLLFIGGLARTSVANSSVLLAATPVVIAIVRRGARARAGRAVALDRRRRVGDADLSRRRPRRWLSSESL